MTFTNLLNDFYCRHLYTKEDLNKCKYISETTDDGMPIKKLFVCNLAKRTTYKDLIKRFSTYGNVQNCFVIRNPRKSNVAFITFDTVESAVRARDEVIQLHNKYLRVEPADSWHQPDSIGYQYYNKDGQTSDKKQLNEQCNQNLVESDITKDSIQILNDDCLIHIFHQLPIVDRIRIERVCKRWRALVQESWSSVKKLDLLCMPNSLYYLVTNTTILRKILLRCGRFLHEINLSQTKYLVPSTSTVVAKLCPNLQKIDVTALTITSSGINSLANHCHDITKLSLKPATYNCDRDLQNLFEVNLKLRYVKIVSGQISGNCLLYLPVETMEEIVLKKCTCLQEKCLSQVFEKLQNLRSLTIDRCYYPYVRTLQAISAHCKNLKILNLLDAIEVDLLSVNDDIVQSIQLPNLETLTINCSTLVTNEFLSNVVSKCQQLTYVNIAGPLLTKKEIQLLLDSGFYAFMAEMGCKLVTSVGIAAIAALPKLETLIMNYLYQVSDTDMRNVCSLKKLECRGSNFTDTTMVELLASASQLELLDLTFCRGITNVTLKEAAAVTVNRTNNILLKIFVGETGVNLNDFKEVSPFLQIVNVIL